MSSNGKPPRTDGFRLGFRSRQTFDGGWPGDPAVNVEESDLEAFWATGDRQFLVYRDSPEPLHFTFEALTGDQRAVAQSMAQPMRDSPEEGDDATDDMWVQRFRRSFGLGVRFDDKEKWPDKIPTGDSGDTVPKMCRRGGERMLHPGFIEALELSPDSAHMDAEGKVRTLVGFYGYLLWTGAVAKAADFLALRQRSTTTSSKGSRATAARGSKTSTARTSKRRPRRTAS